MEHWLRRNRGYLLTFAASVGLSGFLQLAMLQPVGSPVEIAVIEPTPAPTATLAPTPTPAPIAIFVSGEVAQPSVYTLAPGSLVFDAIQAAGGLTATADPTAINQAMRLTDGMQIHVPPRGAAPTPQPFTAPAPTAAPPVAGASPAPDSSTTAGGKVNINSASAAQLDALPGIGPVIAQRVVDYREAHGPFTSVEQITAVSGIGDKLFEKIKDQITTGD